MLSAVVLTRNEGGNLKKCLESLRFCDECIVIDDNSSDHTVKIAESFGAKVFKRELKGDFAAQRNYGQSKAQGDWSLFVDADEVVSPKLRNEIKRAVKNSVQDGYYLRRRDFFWGRELRFGEVKAVRDSGLLRLVKAGSGLWMGSVHEVFHTVKSTGRLDGFLDHHPHQTIKEFIEDINSYSTLRAREIYGKGADTNVFDIAFTPAFKFLYNYLINFGFLDGPPGFAYAFLMSFHSFLVRAKLYQYKKIKTQ